MKTSAYLNFNGDCADAFRFYAETFPGQGLHIMKQGDMQKDATGPQKDLVMHAYLKVGDTDMMASDVFDGSYVKPTGFHVAVNVDSPEEAERLYDALSQGGEITMKMAETFFAHRFGTVVDRFGTPWMIVAQKPMN